MPATRPVLGVVDDPFAHGRELGGAGEVAAEQRGTTRRAERSGLF